MANIAFPSISTSTRLPNGTTYSYVQVEPKGNKPYILFLHGWPDSAYGWKNQIPYFSNLGYGLIVPDLLGCGGTDKPNELEAYKLKKMCEEVIGILDVHGIKEVVGVGHDWGSPFLSRLHNYHPSRFTKYAFLDVGYWPPSGPEGFSVDAINDATTQAIGYPIFGYWHFFNDADAGKVMDEHPESMRAIKYTGSPTFMKETMCPLGACRSYFVNGKTGPIASWATNEEMDTFAEIFAPSNGGYGPSLNWYKAQIANLNTPDEQGISEENRQIHQPTLLVTCAYDAIGVPKMQEEGMRPLVKNLTVKGINSGHFVQLEKPGELNKCLETFISESK